MAVVLNKVYAVKDPMELHVLLVEVGLIPEQGTYMCRKCGHPLTLSRDASRIDGLKWVCLFSEKEPRRKGKKVCGTQVSYRHETFFARSHLSIPDIISFCRLWLVGVSLVDIARSFLGVASKTCIDWASFCREVVFDYCLSETEKLGGFEKVVQIDESKFGKRKYSRGHRVEGQWVFGGYERGSGQIFMACVDKRDCETLVPLIQKWILPGTTIISDCWKAYDCLGEFGYNHLKVNHSINFVDESSGAHTNSIEATKGAAKASMSRPGQRSKNHMPGNLALYMFKKRCREKHLEFTQEFLRHAGVMYNPRHPRQPTTEAGGSSSQEDPSPSTSAALSLPSSEDNPFRDEEDEDFSE